MTRLSERIQRLRELNVADIGRDDVISTQPDENGQAGLFDEEHATEGDVLDIAIDMLTDGMPFEAGGLLVAVGQALLSANDDPNYGELVAGALRAESRERLDDIHTGEEGVLQPVEDSSLLSDFERLLKTLIRLL